MFAVRGDPQKALWGAADEVLAFDLSTDAQEVSPLDSVPEGLLEAKEAYNQLIAQSRAIQHPELPSRFRADEELRQLESLGYVGSPPAPRGPSRPEGPPLPR